MSDVLAWLEKLGLQQYARVFAENDVDLDVVAELNESDLEKLGVSLGHRKKLLREIAHLDRGSSNLPVSPSRNKPLAAEFRYLSVVFCDLVGSTALTSELGAEDMREVNRTYQEVCRSVIERYNGYIARFMGDGVMMYFGFPTAQEDAAERAVRVGLGIVQSMTKLNKGIAQDKGVELSVRVGIASGRVVVDHIGTGESAESNAVGEAPNLAARMQGLAHPNSVIIDDDTKQLAGAVFAYRDIGQQELKGIPELTQAWQVRGDSGVESRFEAASGASMSAFIGRDEELRLLLSRWQQTILGAGQVIVLSGEGGIGKSRLIEEFLENISNHEYQPFRTYCSSYQTQNPMYPVTERLRRQANLTEKDSAARKQRKLENVLIGKYNFSKEVLSVFASLMKIELDESYPALDLTLTQKQSMLQDALIDYLVASSESLPVLILLEDAHWVDPTTKNLMDALVQTLRTKRICMVISSRPENCPDYKHSHVTRLSLSRLSKKQVIVLINNIAKDSHLDEDTVCGIRDKCDGVPLFIEEITKMMMDAGNGKATLDHSSALQVPSTLQASLLARLDKLGAAKEIAQIASVVGDRVGIEIMSMLSGYDTPLVESKLEDLVQHDVLDRRSVNNRVQYEFRHALLRDAAYTSLLSSSQKSIHLKIADYLSRQDRDSVESNAGFIAFHYSHASDNDNAFKYWLLAGHNALEAGATMEAVGLFNSAKKHIPSRQSKDILKQVYQLYLERGHALNAAFGAVSTEAHQSFREAVNVSQALQNIELQVDALDWEFGITFNAGMLKDSIKPAQAMKRIGEMHNHLIATISGYQSIGMAHFAMGEFALARNALESGLKLKGEPATGVNCYPSMSLNYLANVQYITGDIEQARKTCGAALTSARRESVRSMAAALNNSCYALVFLGETELVKQYAEELIELSDKKGQYMYKSRGLFFKHWAEATLNSSDSSLPNIIAALTALLGSKEEIDLTFFLGLVAELQIASEKYDDARVALEAAKSMVDKNHERFYLAELYRLSAALAALVDPNDPECLDLLNTAIETARSQSASSWELRAIKDKQAYLSRMA